MHSSIVLDVIFDTKNMTNILRLVWTPWFNIKQVVDTEY